MTTFNTYQEAKIANPESEIVTKDDCFATKKSMSTYNLMARSTEDQWVICNPADHCMTVEKFLVDGHKFVEGDVYLNSDGRTLGVVNIPEFSNKRSTIDCNLYVLRAAALENKMNIDKVETQAPEELHQDPQQGEVWRCILLPRQYVIYLYKAHNEWDTDWVNSELLECQTINPIQKLYTQSEVEAMPNAVATEHQEEMSAFSGEVEWKNGDECRYKHQPDVTYIFIGMHPFNKKSSFCWNEEDGIAQIHIDFLSKPETKQQREEREREDNAIAYFEFETQCFREAGENDQLLTDSWEQADEVAKEAYRIMAEKLNFKTNYRKGVR